MRSSARIPVDLPKQTRGGRPGFGLSLASSVHSQLGSNDIMGRKFLVCPARIRKPPSKTPLTVKEGVCHTGSFRILVCVTGGFRILGVVSHGFSESTSLSKELATMSL